MTYEYLCTACEHVWEAEQSISAAPLTTCPRCGKDTAKRQVSGGAGFILKGGGWYSDLYASAPKKSEGDAASGSDAKKTGDTKKTETSSSDSSSTKKDTATSSTSSDGASKGSTSGSGKGGADSSAA